MIVALLLFVNLSYASEVNSLCAHLSADIAASVCAEQRVWQWLKAARKGQAPLPMASITLAAGGDAVTRVETLWEEGFVPPGRDLAPWPFALPVDWSADPFEDRNWRFHVQAWRMIDPMIVAWEQTGDDAYFHDAVAVMLDWYRYHYGDAAAESGFQWYDMSVGLRAMKLAYVFSYLLAGDQTVAPAQIAALVHLGDLHAQSLTDPDQLSRGNHGLFQLHGLKALCSVLPALRHCAGHDSYVREQMQDLVRRQFSAEGIHLEHSPAYHFFAYDVFRQFLRSDWYDDYRDLADRMRKAEDNRVWMVHPDSSMVTIGDSRPSKVALDFPQGRPACRENFLDMSACYRLRAFPDSGYAIVRSDWAVPPEAASMLFFTAAFHSQAHKLPDDLSFEWFERGARVLSNSGVYSYDRDPWRDYVTATRAHNTVEIGGRSFPTARQFAYGSALGETRRADGVFHLSGRVSHHSLRAVHERHILYAPGRWLAVVDDVNLRWPSTLTQWFHFAPEFELERAGEHYVATRADGLAILIASNAQETSAVRGQKTPQLQGWVTKRYGEMEPRYALGMHHSGFAAEMVTLFALSPRELDAARRAAARLE